MYLTLVPYMSWIKNLTRWHYIDAFIKVSNLIWNFNCICDIKVLGMLKSHCNSNYAGVEHAVRLGDLSQV